MIMNVKVLERGKKCFLLIFFSCYKLDTPLPLVNKDAVETISNLIKCEEHNQKKPLFAQVYPLKGLRSAVL